jgi:hypothetical protein
MFFLLLNPWVRNAAIAVAISVILVLGYAYWAGHEKAIGAANERAQEEVVAIENEQKVDAEAVKIDQSVSQDNAPQNTLQKQWSQP